MCAPSGSQWYSTHLCSFLAAFPLEWCSLFLLTRLHRCLLKNRDSSCISLKVDFMRSRDGDVMLLVLRVKEKTFPFSTANVSQGYTIQSVTQITFFQMQVIQNKSQCKWQMWQMSTALNCKPIDIQILQNPFAEFLFNGLPSFLLGFMWCSFSSLIKWRIC